MIKPDPDIAKLGLGAERQREYGLLRAQQRAARSIVTLLREKGLLNTQHATVEIRVDGEEITGIRVSQATLSIRMLAQFEKGGTSDDPTE